LLRGWPVSRCGGGSIRCARRGVELVVNREAAVIGAVLLELALEQLGDEFLDAEFGKGVAQP
jgi:hypothetical protein